MPLLCFSILSVGKDAKLKKNKLMESKGDILEGNDMWSLTSKLLVSSPGGAVP